MPLGHFFQDIPYDGLLAVNHLLGRAHGVHIAKLLEAVDDEGFEQAQSHLLGKTALVHLQVRTNHNHGTAGVVHTLTEQVLTEAAALALQHVGKGLQRTVAGTGHVATMATVVKQGVHSLLQHAHFVALNHLGSLKSGKLAQTVITVDNAAVQVVQVTGGKATTGQRNEGTQVRGNYGQRGKHHPLRLATAHAEALHQLKALGQLTLILLGIGLFHLLAQLVHKGIQVDGGQKALNSSSTHACLGSVIAVVLHKLLVLFLGQNLAAFDAGHIAGIDNDVILVVDDAFQVAGGQVEHEADAAGHTLVEPDVSHRHSQIDVAHALTTHAGGSHLHAAAVTDHALVLGALVAATGAFHVAGRAEDAFAEQTTLLRLEGTVVNRLRVLDLAAGPAQDIIRAGHGDANLIEVLGLLVVKVVKRHIGIFLRGLGMLPGSG